eukprot:1158036-Pelagomonas_calceolata.AAC.3
MVESTREPTTRYSTDKAGEQPIPPSRTLIQGMGGIDIPTHTQEHCVEDDLSTLSGYGDLGCSVHEVKWPN